MTRIVEVGPRDGLQNESAIVPTEIKVAFIDALSTTGVDEIEVSSFVSPEWIPQLSDAEAVFARIQRHPQVAYSALVPNARGMERALACKVDKIAVFTAASETFCQNNINTSQAGSLARFAAVVPLAQRSGVGIRGYVSTAFHCPYEGSVPVQAVVDVVDRLLQLGCESVSLGDTIGRATPQEVARVLETLTARLSPRLLALHLHDTNGLAAENIRQALAMGVEEFDASAGGLGGCPYAGPGAHGNVATEVLVETLRGAGRQVRVDLQRVAAARAILAPQLGRPWPIG